jgi:excisionase family DNA binding protein
MHTHTIKTSHLTLTDINMAQQSSDFLNKISESSSVYFVGIKNDRVPLPPSAVKLLVEIMNQMAQGHTLTVVPQKDYITTQESADLLNVSRPFFVKLLESGKIPYKKVGNRRRILSEDVLKYKNNIQKKRVHVLQELVDQAQELDLGYK